MTELAPGVWQLAGLLPHVVNAYLISAAGGEVLVDAGTRWDAGLILRQLRGRPLALVALTHCHPDHQGSAAEVCRRRGVPLVCHEADADVMEGRAPVRPRTPAARLSDLLLSGPPYPVARRWRGGEAVGDFRVVHAPGHTPGHVLLHREADGVVIAGDVVRTLSYLWGPGHVLEPPHFFSVDPRQNRDSIRLLLGLRPRLVLVGHGPPLRELAALECYVARLDAEERRRA
jgi:glyoxylase-like metal-dependent hydrolase (beta-lactamase superfamily II)